MMRVHCTWGCGEDLTLEYPLDKTSIINNKVLIGMDIPDAEMLVESLKAGIEKAKTLDKGYLDFLEDQSHCPIKR